MRVNCFIRRTYYWLENVTICSSASWLLRAEGIFLVEQFSSSIRFPWKCIACLYTLYRSCWNETANFGQVLRTESVDTWKSALLKNSRRKQRSEQRAHELKGQYEGWHSLAYQLTQSQPAYASTMIPNRRQNAAIYVFIDFHSSVGDEMIEKKCPLPHSVWVENCFSISVTAALIKSPKSHAVNEKYE